MTYPSKLTMRGGTLRQKRWFQSSHFPFICSNIPATLAYTCIWRIYLSVDTIFQSLWFLQIYQDSLYRKLLLTRQLLNQGFLLVKLKSSLRKFYGLGWPLWNICVTNNHGFVPLVENISRSFPHSWLITVFVTRLTRRVPFVEQDIFTLPEHMSSPPVLV